MQTFIKIWLIASISFASLACAAKDEPVLASNSSLYVDGSLCTKPDQIVFSCPLDKNRKIVSMCAAGSTAPHKFYYVFGSPHAVEMTYPAIGENLPKAFEQAHLFFAGATGGYAYSFTNQDYKYILYSVSGTGFDTAGVLIQHQGELRALSDMKCQSGKLKENEDDDLQNSIHAWEHDRSLELHGLPHVPRT